jgi:4-amino-4-deoxy-L-arabinose transferase-like glycosyltransferase
MPWTVIGIRALFDGVEVSIAEWTARRKPMRYLGHGRAGDAFPEFLVLWAIFPILFFSFSGSKLPGYILPSIPPLTILTGDYLYRIRERGMSRWLLWSHAACCAVLVFVLLLAPQHMKYDTLVPPKFWLAVAGLSAACTIAMVIFVARRWGTQQLCKVSLVPVLAMMIFLLGFHGRELDLNYSARPLAQEISTQAPNEKTVAVLGIKRDMDYGLAFYRNERLVHYDHDGVPEGEHLLVVRASDTDELDRWLTGRVYTPLFLYDAQGFEVYKVFAKQ